MSAKDRMISQFRAVDGGLFSTVTKADVGEGAANFIASGGINMAWADMFFPSPFLQDTVKNAMLEAIEEKTISHYVPPIGDLPLRKAIAKKVSKMNGIAINPTRNVIATPGSDSALLFAMMPFLEKGDEVLIPDPSYPSNAVNAKLLGAKAVSVPLDESKGYQPQAAVFESFITDKTKMIVLSHPNNPTTTVFRRENLKALCEIIVKYNLILVSDQAFEDHIYDDIEFVSPCTFPGMWERTLTVCSLSKGYGLSGLRIGYIYSNEYFMDKLYGAAVNVLGATNTLASRAATAAFEDETLLKDNFIALERRRTIVNRILGSGIKGVSMTPSESGILTWLNIQKLGTSDEVVAYLMKEANVLVNSGVPYGRQGEGYIRIVTACIHDDNEAERYLTDIRSALIKLGEEKNVTE